MELVKNHDDKQTCDGQHCCSGVYKIALYFPTNLDPRLLVTIFCLTPRLISIKRDVCCGLLTLHVHVHQSQEPNINISGIEYVLFILDT